MIWTYVLCVACLFMLLISFKRSSFNFDNVQFISFIINHGFIVTTMFPSGCFIVLGFTFNLRMHLEKNVYYGRCISKLERKRDISVISMNARHFYSKSSLVCSGMLTFYMTVLTFESQNALHLSQRIQEEKCTLNLLSIS